MYANNTYRISCWYAESSNYNGPDDSGFFHSRAFSSSGAHVSTPASRGTLLKTRVVDGLTWEYRYIDITFPSDYSGTFEWYIGYNGSNGNAGYRYFTGVSVTKPWINTSYAHNNFVNTSYNSIRSFLHYDEKATGDVSWWKPAVYAVDGTEPSLSDLISNTLVGDFRESSWLDKEYAVTVGGDITRFHLGYMDTVSFQSYAGADGNEIYKGTDPFGVTSPIWRTTMFDREYGTPSSMFGGAWFNGGKSAPARAFPKLNSSDYIFAVVDGTNPDLKMVSAFHSTTKSVVIPQSAFATSLTDFHTKTAGMGIWTNGAQLDFDTAGLKCTGYSWFGISTGIPITDENQTFVVEVEMYHASITSGKKLYIAAQGATGFSTTGAGVSTRYHLESDKFDTYNYNVTEDTSTSSPYVATYTSNPIGGFNAARPAEGSKDKFDPGSTFLDIVFLTGYSGTHTDVSYIKNIKITSNYDISTTDEWVPTAAGYRPWFASYLNTENVNAAWSGDSSKGWTAGATTLTLADSRTGSGYFVDSISYGGGAGNDPQFGGWGSKYGDKGDGGFISSVTIPVDHTKDYVYATYVRLVRPAERTINIRIEIPTASEYQYASGSLPKVHFKSDGVWQDYGPLVGSGDFDNSAERDFTVPWTTTDFRFENTVDDAIGFSLYVDGIKISSPATAYYYGSASSTTSTGSYTPSDGRWRVYYPSSNMHFSEIFDLPTNQGTFYFGLNGTHRRASGAHSSNPYFTYTGVGGNWPANVWCLAVGYLYNSGAADGATNSLESTSTLAGVYRMDTGELMYAAQSDYRMNTDTTHQRIRSFLVYSQTKDVGLEWYNPQVFERYAGFQPSDLFAVRLAKGVTEVPATLSGMQSLWDGAGPGSVTASPSEKHFMIPNITSGLMYTLPPMMVELKTQDVQYAQTISPIYIQASTDNGTTWTAPDADSQVQISIPHASSGTTTVASLFATSLDRNETKQRMFSFDPATTHIRFINNGDDGAKIEHIKCDGVTLDDGESSVVLGWSGNVDEAKSNSDDLPIRTFSVSFTPIAGTALEAWKNSIGVTLYNTGGSKTATHVLVRDGEVYGIYGDDEGFYVAPSPMQASGLFRAGSSWPLR